MQFLLITSIWITNATMFPFVRPNVDIDFLFGKFYFTNSYTSDAPHCGANCPLERAHAPRCGPKRGPNFEDHFRDHDDCTQNAVDAKATFHVVCRSVFSVRFATLDARLLCKLVLQSFENDVASVSVAWSMVLVRRRADPSKMTS